jgi:hypothetical protein
MWHTPTDTEDGHQLGALFSQFRDLLGIGRQLGFGGEMTLLGRHGVITQRTVKRLLQSRVETLLDWWAATYCPGRPTIRPC